jgi:hypothetical protein
MLASAEECGNKLFLHKKTALGFGLSSFGLIQPEAIL